MSSPPRLLTRLVVAGLLVTSLAACGASGGSDSSKAETTSPDKPAKTTTTEEATTTTEEVTTTTADDSGVGDPTDQYVQKFDDETNADNWDTGSNDKGAVGLEDGAYYTDVAPNGQFFLAADDFRDWKTASVGASLDIKRFGQGTPLAGITCFSQFGSDGKLSAYYDLLVSSAGNVSIYKYETGKEPVVLLDKTAIDGFEVGKPFSLQLACVEGDDGVGLSVRYNDEPVRTVVDEDPLPAGAVRIETWGDEEKLSTVYFDAITLARFD